MGGMEEGLREMEDKRERMYWVMSTPPIGEECTRREDEVRLKFDSKNVRAPRYGGCYWCSFYVYFRQNRGNQSEYQAYSYQRDAWQEGWTQDKWEVQKLSDASGRECADTHTVWFPPKERYTEWTSTARLSSAKSPVTPPRGSRINVYGHY